MASTIPGKRSRRLPDHFTVCPDGDVLATDLVERRMYRWPRAQVEGILSLDATIHNRGHFDPKEDAVSGSFSNFKRIWEQDQLSQYGLVSLNQPGSHQISRDPIPSHLVLSGRAENGEGYEPKFVQGLMKIAVKNYVREHDSRDFHVNQRKQKRARREGVATHSARLPLVHHHSFLLDKTASTITLDDTGSVFEYPSGVPTFFNADSESALTLSPSVRQANLGPPPATTDPNDRVARDSPDATFASTEVATNPPDIANTPSAIVPPVATNAPVTAAPAPAPAPPAVAAPPLPDGPAPAEDFTVTDVDDAMNIELIDFIE